MLTKYQVILSLLFPGLLIAAPGFAEETLATAAAQGSLIASGAQRQLGADAYRRMHSHLNLAAGSAPEISLWIYSPSDPDIQLWAASKYLFSRDADKELYRAAKDSALKDILAAYQQRGWRIKRLTIVSHGMPGWTDIPNTFNIASLEDKGFDQIFTPHAEIDIYACNSGSGVIGADFVQRIGQALLKANGGTVYAPRWYYFFLPIPPPLLPAGSPDGWRQYTVQPGGQGSLSEPVDLSAEKLRLQQEADKLGRELDDTANFKHDAANSHDLSLAYDDLAQARDNLASLEWNLQKASLTEWCLETAAAHNENARQEFCRSSKACQ